MNLLWMPHFLNYCSEKQTIGQCEDGTCRTKTMIEQKNEINGSVALYVKLYDSQLGYFVIISSAALPLTAVDGLL